jgi:hypothetical protein
MSINAVRLGVAAGLVWGIGMFLCTVLSIYSGYGQLWLGLMSDIYPGFSISWQGAIAGLVYGFIDAGLGFFLIGWIYNKLPF